MADDADDWFSGANDPEPEPAAAPAAAAGPAAPASVGDEPALGSVSEESSMKKREKGERTTLYRVWKRPVFLQYSYLYDYRHNYYDDVIDYLDRRQRGLQRDIPRPQTWAERALRTYTSKVRGSAAYERREKDISLMSDIRTSARFYNYHSREYMSQKYSKYLL